MDNTGPYYTYTARDIATGKTARIVWRTPAGRRQERDPIAAEGYRRLYGDSVTSYARIASTKTARDQWTYRHTANGKLWTIRHDDTRMIHPDKLRELLDAIDPIEEEPDTMKPDILIVIDGGTLQAVASTGDPVTYRLIDLDNIKAGDAVPDGADLSDHDHVDADDYTQGWTDTAARKERQP
jgi:hypothetical protein